MFFILIAFGVYIFFLLLGIHKRKNHSTIIAYSLIITSFAWMFGVEIIQNIKMVLPKVTTRSIFHPEFFVKNPLSVIHWYQVNGNYTFWGIDGIFEKFLPAIIFGGAIFMAFSSQLHMTKIIALAIFGVFLIPIFSIFVAIFSHYVASIEYFGYANFALFLWHMLCVIFGIFVAKMIENFYEKSHRPV